MDKHYVSEAWHSSPLFTDDPIRSGLILFVCAALGVKPTLGWVLERPTDWEVGIPEYTPERYKLARELFPETVSVGVQKEDDGLDFILITFWKSKEGRRKVADIAPDQWL